MKETQKHAPEPVRHQEEAAPRSTQFKHDLRNMGVSQQIQAMRPAPPVQFAGGGGGTEAVHKAAREGVSGSGGALPHLDAIQHAFGDHDVSGVQAHVGGAAAQANEQMGSMAYATGNDIAFKGSPDLHTAAHEAAHVVQQRAGVSLDGGVGQVGDRYEQHADAVADAVVQGRSAQGLLDTFTGGGAGVQAKAIQMIEGEDDHGHDHSHDHDHSEEVSPEEEGANDKLNKIVGDGTYAKGKVKHQTPAQADAAIQKHLSAYVADAVKAGRKIAGKVAVVGDADWDKAGEFHYGKEKWHAKRKGSSRLYRDSINGFVDKKGRVWIHKDRGNPGTMIHEAVHKYSDRAMIGVSQPLNEGVTEYFTRKVCKEANITKTRGNYNANYKTVVALVKLVGEKTVAAAYFDGNVDGLKKAFVAKKSKEDYDAFIKATKNNKWSEARKKL